MHLPCAERQRITQEHIPIQWYFLKWSICHMCLEKNYFSTTRLQIRQPQFFTMWMLMYVTERSICRKLVKIKTAVSFNICHIFKQIINRIDTNLEVLTIYFTEASWEVTGQHKQICSRFFTSWLTLEYCFLQWSDCLN